VTVSTDIPRIERRTARRIDRLARGAHAFHRFAHHPLCAQYESEVLRIGRKLRLCRGCTFVASGLCTGAVLMAAVAIGAPSVRLHAAWLVIAAATALAALLLVQRSIERRSQARKSKWLTRFAAAAGIGGAVSAAIARVDSVFGAVLVALTAIACALLVLQYRRRGPDRAPCSGCSERSLAVCSGYAPIVRRERAFQRRALVLLSERP
jgi:hypothetical protein